MACLYKFHSSSKDPVSFHLISNLLLQRWIKRYYNCSHVCRAHSVVDLWDNCLSHFKTDVNGDSRLPWLFQALPSTDSLEMLTFSCCVIFHPFQIKLAVFPFNFPPLISKFKLLKLLWLVSGCLFQCTQFRILVHQHSIWDLIPLCIWISPLGEYYPSPCACKIRIMLMVCMSSSISPLKSGFFNQFSVQSLDRHIFFSLKIHVLKPELSANL